MSTPHRTVVVGLVSLLWACGDDGGNLQDNNPPAVARVTVEAASTTIAVGGSVQLQAVVRDADGNPLDDRTVTWASANMAIATVSASGMVTGVSAGEAPINASVDTVTGTLAITVSATEPPPPGDAGLEQIASGLAFPVGLASPPGDTRLFVVEKG